MRLTPRLKTITLSFRTMNRPPLSLALLLLLSAGCALLLGGCASAGPPSQLKFGLWAAERNLWDEAIFRWQKVLAADPSSVAAHNNLGVAYEKKGLWDKARAAYEAALKIDPKNSSVKTNFDRFKEQQDALKKEEEKEKEKKAKEQADKEKKEKEKKGPGGRP
jgi:tetratricopeptide (TPR) repeat protein